MVQFYELLKLSLMPYLGALFECLGAHVGKYRQRSACERKRTGSLIICIQAVRQLLERVQNELLAVYTNHLLEKEHSRCRALLRDDKVDDISRMYRLFHKIPKGLKHVGNTFKQHVTSEGMVLFQQAEETASNKSENAGGTQEQDDGEITIPEGHNKDYDVEPKSEDFHSPDTWWYGNVFLFYSCH